MTSRTTLRYPEGTTTVGTARVREDTTVGRSYAERELMRRNGGKPNGEFDEIADGVDAGAKAIASSVASSAAVAGGIGQATPMGKTLKRLTKPAAPKKSKYGNEKCTSGGIKFDSKREMMRWHDLVQMQVRGEISELELQVPFILDEAFEFKGEKFRAEKYIADFVYEKDGQTVIEDVKGVRTREFRRKRRQMAKRGLTIVEIK